MNATAIPSALQQHQQWVLWRVENRDGKPTKCPYQAASPNRRASSTDPRTWASYETAVTAAATADGIAGIGFVFTADDPFAGVDLDACIDPDTGEMHPAAGAIIDELGSYWEPSPSRTGVHVIVQAELNGRRHATHATPWGDEFAVYTTGRFFTVNGRGTGQLRACQAELDAIVTRILGAATNGTSASDPPSPTGSTPEVLGRHDDLAKLVARKGTPPGDGSGHAWDFALACRAAEHGYDDSVLGQLIRHARQLHGEEKGERADYLERTVTAVRQRVGHVGIDAGQDAMLTELTKTLRLHAAGRHVVATVVTGHGNSATAAIELDDGYTIEFESFEHVAQPAKLADTLATTVGIATDFTKMQSRRAASLVRRSADRGEEFRQHSIHVDAAARLLRIAEPLKFDVSDQSSRWTTWLLLEDTDPDVSPADSDEWKSRPDDRHAAETYGRRIVIPVDAESGVRFVHAGWFQQFMRLRLGPATTPQKTRQALLRTGWQTRGRDGRIKATRPVELGPEHAEIPLTFYLVARGWETRLGATEIGGGSR